MVTAPLLLRATSMDVAEWLRGLGLDQYVSAFRANDIDAEVLRRLTAEDLRELGVRRLATAACSTLSLHSVMVYPQLKRRTLLPQPPLPPPRPSAASSPSCSATSLARLNWPHGSIQRTCTTSSPPIIAASPR